MSHREPEAAAERVRAEPNTPEAGLNLYETILGHLRAGRFLDAQLCCRQILETHPDHAETLHLMGLVCFNAGQFDHALEWASRAIRKDPKPAYLTTLGITLLNLGRRDDALEVFDKAVQLKPHDAGLWKNLGDVLADMQRRDEALLSYRQAVTLDPCHWDAARKAGLLLYEAGQLPEALVYIDLCDRHRPDDAVTLHLRGVVHNKLKKFDEALADSERAHALDPSNAHNLNNLGDVLRLLGRHRQALPWFDRALELKPDFVEALNNKAFSLVQLHRFEEAFEVYRRSRAAAPQHAETDWNLALLHLLTGDFEAGWAGRESRWNAKSLPVFYPKFPQPKWRGEAVDGKTILLFADEGLGDSIQFVRYVPLLASRGARVILAVEDALCPLLSPLAGVSRCLPKSTSALPAFDLHFPISSLPFVFETRLDSVPAATSYLPSPAADRVLAWEGRLGPRDRLRVGLVWSGNPDHANDHNRSIPLRLLSRILDVDASFVSLQKNVRPGDKAALLEYGEIIDLTADLTDFAETAALVSCLDLVITVDTSVAHLAAALGRPTWILLPYTPDYRWLLDRDESPWYPSVRLFRQDESRDYAGVLDRVRQELLAIASHRRP